MSFNSVTLTVAAVIFVILLIYVAYFIYQDQKSKFSMVQSTCPDYWQMNPVRDASGNYYCQQQGTNIGTCSVTQGSANRPPIYTILNSNNECDNYKRKMAWIGSSCGRTILWDGVTNNPTLKDKCK
jgi:hypothetical protein